MTEHVFIQLFSRQPVGDSRPACFLHRCVISARIGEGLKAGLAPPVGRCDARAVGIRPGLRGVRPVSSDRGKDAMRRSAITCGVPQFVWKTRILSVRYVLKRILHKVGV